MFPSLPQPLPEDERHQVLKDYRVLDGHPEESFDDLALLASQICQTPIALINFVDSERQWIKANIGFTDHKLSHPFEFCLYTLHQSDLFVIPDAEVDCRFSDSQIVTQVPNVRFYAGVPLWTPEGHVLGTLCVMDRVPRDLSVNQKDGLRALGRQVVILLEYRCEVFQSGKSTSRQLKEELAKKEEHIGLLMESTAEGIYGIDLDGICTFCNPACLQILGYEDRQDIYGKNMHALIHHTQQNGTLCDRRQCQLSQALQTENGVHVDSEIFWRKDGTSFPTEYWAYPILREGQLIGTVVTFFDISERKQNEEALQEMNVALTHATPGISLLTYEGRYLQVNDVYARLLGYTSKELIGKSWRPTVHPDDYARAVEAFDVMKATGKGEFEARAMRKDGSCFYKHVVMVRGLTKVDVPDSYHCFMRDITTQKQTEDELDKQRQFLRQVIDTIPNFVFVKDRAGRFLLANLAVGKAYGTTVEELLGKSDSDFNDNPKEVEFFRQKDLMVLDSSQDVFIPEEIITDASGKTRWLQTMKRPLIGRDGIAYAVLGVSTDITSWKHAQEALKVSEERLRLALEASREGVWDWDISTGTVLFSSRWRESLGFSLEDVESTMAFWEQLAHPDDRVPMSNALAAHLEGHTSMYEYESRLRTKSGMYRWNLRRGKIVARDHTGRPRRMVGVDLDITDRKRAEMAYLQDRKLESVGMLAGGIAQDFNNYLMTILGSITLAQHALKPETQANSHLSIAESACEDAKSLSERLLTFSKGGSPVRETVLVENLINKSVGYALGGSYVRYIVSLSRDLLPVHVDEGQICQALNNILQNAAQAMPNGGLITIQAENLVMDRNLSPVGTTLQSCQYVKLSVNDQGGGMESSMMEKIFDPYFTTKSQSVGLGLTTTFAILKNHGGDITVESQVNSGSTFFLYLPASDETALTKSLGTKEGVVTGQGRVLIMDDERSIREVLADMCRQIGYSVEVTQDGEDAIERVCQYQSHEQRIDIAILDLSIPGKMGGKDAVAKLRNIDSRIKMVVSSGYSDDEVISDPSRFGFDGVITKPYTLAKLSQVLHAVINDL